MPRNNYLLNEIPISVYPSLVEKFGLNEAIFLQVLHNWFMTYEQSRKDSARHWQKGRWWAYGTPETWKENNMPFLSASTIKRAITSLKEKGVILVDRFNKASYDRTNWYSIDYDALDAIMDGSIVPERPEPLDQNDPMEEVNVTPTIPISSSMPSSNNLPAAVADAPGDWGSEADWDKTNPMVVYIYPEDMTFHCPNPFCDVEVAWASLRKSKAMCPHCRQHISGIEYGGKTPTYKPPKAVREKQILGNLLPNIAEAYAYLPYFANDAAKLKLMLDKHSDLLYNCLQWSVSRVADSRMPEHKAVGAALSLVEKKLRAKVATSATTTTKEAIKDTDITSDEMERIKQWASKLG